MRWIITSDHMGTSLAGVGEDAEGSIAYAGTNEGDSLPMEFRLYDARHKLCFEGRCGAPPSALQREAKKRPFGRP